MIDPDNLPEQPEQLTKVLTSDNARFTLSVDGSDPIELHPVKAERLIDVLPSHLREAGLPFTKVLPAGGPLLGQEPCPACGHFPGEARDNPFRACATCRSKTV